MTGVEEREVAVGGSMVISIDSNPTTGYRWEASFDEGMLALQSEEYQRRSRLIGGGGRQVFTFVPLRAGDAVVRMRYRRPWEEEAVEERTYAVHAVDESSKDPSGPAPESLDQQD